MLKVAAQQIHGVPLPFLQREGYFRSLVSLSVAVCRYLRFGRLKAAYPPRRW
jgi:hypothetical protein